MRGPSRLAKHDPRNPGVSVRILVEYLEVALAKLDIGADEGVLAGGQRIFVELALGEIAAVGLDQLPELEVSSWSGADIVDTDL